MQLVPYNICLILLYCTIPCYTNPTMLEYIKSFLDLHPMVFYSLLFLLCFLEGLPIIGSLVAGGTVAIGIGTLAFVGLVDPVTALIVMSLGSFAGDLAGYFTIKHFRTKIARFQRMVQPLEDNQSRFSRFFDQNFFLVTILSRLVPMVRSLPSLFAAIRKIESAPYVIASVLASILWASSGILIGYGASTVVSPQVILMIIIASVILPSVYGIVKLILHQKNKNHPPKG